MGGADAKKAFAAASESSLADMHATRLPCCRETAKRDTALPIEYLVPLSYRYRVAVL
jgi:hypothetical protein